MNNNDNLGDKLETSSEKKHSRWEMLAFSCAPFNNAVNGGFIWFYFIFFWEVEIGLPIVLISLAMTIFSIWDAVNDPLVGYLSDKPRWYTKRWGRRFPLILLGSVPFGIFTLLLFFPPSIDPAIDPIPLFLYFLIVMLFWELVSALQYINRSALYPQKFRTDKERRTIVGMESVFFRIVGLISQFLPAFIIVVGDIASYQTAALLMFFIGIPGIIPIIFGTREDKEMIEQTLRAHEQHSESTKFIPTLKILIKKRNFFAIVVPPIIYSSATAMTGTATLYFLVYVMGLEMIDITPVLLLSGVIAFPLIFLLIRIVKKAGFVKSFLLGLFLAGLNLTVFLIIMITTQSIIGLYVFVILQAFSFILIDLSDSPLDGWFLDELIAEEKRRIEGAFYGIKYFFLYLAIGPINYIVLALTHDLLGFDPNATVQSSSAILGIYLHGAIIPMIFYWISGILFWKIWTITQEQSEENRKKLVDLGL